MAIKVLATDGFAKNGEEILRDHSEFDLDIRKGVSKEDLEKIIGDYDCIIIRSATKLTADLIDKASNMKLIVRAGAGVDNIDVPRATEKKIPVMNTATANSLAAAEQTIALLFALFRNLPQAAASLKAGKWDRDIYKGYEVTGKTLGLVGLGNIGRIVGEKAVGLGMKVHAYDPFVQSPEQIKGPLGQAARSGESVKISKSLDEVVSNADVLTVHVPKVKETANLLNAERISKMKEGSWLLNCARGGIVDEKAVLSAIEGGQLRGAAFDVYEKEPPNFPNPLFEHPKVVCAPHLGASTFEAQARVASTAAQQMIGFFKENSREGVINQ